MGWSPGRCTNSSHDTFFQVLALTCAETRRGFDRHVGMSQPRRQLLAVLAAEAEISHAALAEHLGVDGAAITRLVKTLESQGAVRRRLDPDDNRFTLASLTDAGENLVADLQAAHRRYQAQLLTGISKDAQVSVVRALECVRRNAAQVHRPAADTPGNA
jgi:DNA-binding MarR family transcriptional regulator